jgi:hypothetical protein
MTHPWTTDSSPTAPDAMDHADATSVEGAEAHALKSASLSIWAVELAGSLEEAESAAVSGDVPRAQSLMDPVRAKLRRVVDYVDVVLMEGS